MKIYDEVILLIDRKEYNDNGIFKGMIGTVWSGEIRDESFLVLFIDENFKLHKDDVEWFEENAFNLKDDITIPIKIEDLEVVKEGNATDEMILEDIPKQNPKWWCKVENGYIMNLLGEKKNKIPYDYKS